MNMARSMYFLKTFPGIYNFFQYTCRPTGRLRTGITCGSSFYHAHTIERVFQPYSENSRAWNYMKSTKTYLGKIATDKLVFDIKERSKERFDSVSTIHFISLSENKDADKNIEISLDSNSVLEIISKIGESSVDDVITFIHLLGKWPLTDASKTQSFHRMWNALDDRSCAILENQTVDDILLVADCWFHLRLNRLTKYNERMINHLLFNRLGKLSASEFVQLMFYVNLERSLSPGLSDRAEHKLSTVIDALTVEEIGIVALGFFKTKNGIRSLHLLQTMIFRLTSSLAEVDDYTFTSIVKCFRKSSHLQSLNSLIQSFLMCCHNHIDGLSVTACMHLCSLGTYQQVYNKSIMSKILEKCGRETESLRLKDLAQLMFASSLFHHKDNFYFVDQARRELRSRFDTTEVTEYPRPVVTCLLSLTYYDIYEEDLISKVLSKEFLKNLESKGNFDARRDTFALHHSLKIDCPNYDGNYLPDDKLKLYRDHVSSQSSPCPDSFQHKMMQNIVFNLSIIFGRKESVAVKRMLPHYRLPDIYVQASGRGVIGRSATRFPREMETVLSNKWMCFLIGGKNCYTYQTGERTGYFNKKKSQLMTLGYRVIEVPWFEYWNKSSLQQKTYLEQKIFK